MKEAAEREGRKWMSGGCSSWRKARCGSFRLTELWLVCLGKLHWYSFPFCLLWAAWWPHTDGNIGFSFFPCEIWASLLCAAKTRAQPLQSSAGQPPACTCTIAAHRAYQGSPLLPFSPLLSLISYTTLGGWFWQNQTLPCPLGTDLSGSLSALAMALSGAIPRCTSQEAQKQWVEDVCSPSCIVVDMVV